VSPPDPLRNARSPAGLALNAANTHGGSFRPSASSAAHAIQARDDPPQPPTRLVGDRNAEMHREQLACRHPLLTAHKLPANAG
jgi:hypothetical protein